jgi:hypothetical protein
MEMEVGGLRKAVAGATNVVYSKVKKWRCGGVAGGGLCLPPVWVA